MHAHGCPPLFHERLHELLRNLALAAPALPHGRALLVFLALLRLRLSRRRSRCSHRGGRGRARSGRTRCT